MAESQGQESRTGVDSNASLGSSQQHTKNHQHPCPACLSAEVILLSPSARESFPIAAEAWLKTQSKYIGPRTRKCYGQYIATLGEFLGEIRLIDIRNGTIEAYKEWRLLKAGNTRTNNETGCLRMILKDAGLWKRLEENYRALPRSTKKVRKSMQEAEVMRLINASLRKPKRRVAGHCLIVMMYTSMGFGEMRHLRRCDVFLNTEIPFIKINGGTKNDYRIRDVTLNRVALRSMRWIIHRWEDLGGTDPEQYILPHRAAKRGGKTQFDIPMGHIYRAARGILNDADLKNIVPYDMRSQFITKVSADPECTDQIYSELTGHTPKDVREMRNRYSRQLLETKAKITDKLCEFSEKFEPERVGFTVIEGGKKKA